MKNESPDSKWELLNSGLNIYISKEYTFGTDAVKLAEFAAPKKGDTVCDMGTGCGIIPMLLCEDKAPSHIYGVDIQAEAIAQFTRTINENNLAEYITPIKGDIREIKNAIPAELFGRFDLVIMNPPYKPVGTGVPSISKPELIARHEVMCTIEDAAKAASGLLRFGGRFSICHRPERLSDCICAMRNNGLEPKRIQLAVNGDRKTPWLVLIESRKGSGKGLCQLLIVN
jgi:tRNA1(Val) A37 N6-methylase TrmN6